MTNREKIALLEDMMELEEGTLNERTALVDIAEWDSLAALSLMALMDERFGKTLTGEQIRGFKAVQDILDFMG